jgi:hypothetical protein
MFSERHMFEVFARGEPDMSFPMSVADGDQSA